MAIGRYPIPPPSSEDLNSIFEEEAMAQHIEAAKTGKPLKGLWSLKVGMWKYAHMEIINVLILVLCNIPVINFSQRIWIFFKEFFWRKYSVHFLNLFLCNECMTVKGLQIFMRKTFPKRDLHALILNVSKIKVWFCLTNRDKDSWW